MTTDIYVATNKTPSSPVHLRRLQILPNCPKVGEPMGSLASVHNTLEENESCDFIMVPDNRQHGPFEKPTQGSLLVVINLVLKLFGYFKEFMIGSEKLSAPQKFENVAFFENPMKISVGCLTIKYLESLMDQRHVSVPIITEGFDAVFLDNQDSSDSVYSVQCEVPSYEKQS
jgi:hypothetical protein